MFEQDSALAHPACKMVAFLDRKTPDFMPPCCLMLIQQTFFISEQDKVCHRSRVTTDRTSCEKPVYTHDTLWRQHYITTSKEYLTNGHILLKYFKLVFLQLHQVKISGKLITIRLNYKKTKRAPFYETPCIILFSDRHMDRFQNLARVVTW